MHDFGRIERELQGHHAAIRMADDVRALDAEMPKQSAGIGGLLGNAHRAGGGVTLAVADAVIVDEAIPPGESRVVHQRRKSIRDEAAVHE